MQVLECTRLNLGDGFLGRQLCGVFPDSRQLIRIGKYGAHDLIEPVRREIVHGQQNSRDGDGLYIAVHALVRTLCKDCLMEDAGVRQRGIFMRT